MLLFLTLLRLGLATTWQIPKIIHFFWMGQPIQKINPTGYNNMALWAAAHNGWNIWCWSDDKSNCPDGTIFQRASARSLGISGDWAKIFNGYVTKGTQKARAYAGASDIARLFVLKEYGGLYVDVDIAPGEFDFKQIVLDGFPLRFSPPFRTTDVVYSKLNIPKEKQKGLTQDLINQAVAVSKNAGDAFGNAVVIAPAKSALLVAVMKDLLVDLKNKQAMIDLFDDEPAHHTGPGSLSRALLRGRESTAYLRMFVDHVLLQTVMSDLPLQWITDASDREQETRRRRRHRMRM